MSDSSPPSGRMRSWYLPWEEWRRRAVISTRHRVDHTLDGMAASLGVARSRPSLVQVYKKGGS